MAVDQPASTTGELRANELVDDLRGIETDIDAKAEQIRDAYKAKRQRVENDPDLNPLARRKKLDEARDGAKQQMAELREDLARRHRDAVTSSINTLLGIAPTGDPARLSSFRDARSRARQLRDQNTAVEAMMSARRDDDREQVEALCAVALERGWPRVWRAAPELAAGVEMIYRAQTGGGRGQLFRFSLGA